MPPHKLTGYVGNGTQPDMSVISDNKGHSVRFNGHYAPVWHQPGNPLQMPCKAK
jgi:hypothetical protein